MSLTSTAASGPSVSASKEKKEKKEDEAETLEERWQRLETPNNRGWLTLTHMHSPVLMYVHVVLCSLHRMQEQRESL